MHEKILMIDDDLDTLRLVGLMLQKQGYHVMAANSGKQALEQIEVDLPDLVLLDVMMPSMDGYEVARRIKADQKTAGIPILMFSAKSLLDDKVSGFKAGADDYLTKPTHPSELYAKIRGLLDRAANARFSSATKPLGEKAIVLGFIAARGGLGVTSVSSNLAASLQKLTQREVILAEFTPGMGSLSYEMGMSNDTGFTGLMQTSPKNITRQMIEEMFYIHPGGLKLLMASGKPKDAAIMENDGQLEAILSRLEFMANYVVLDLGSQLSTGIQNLVKKLDEIFIIVESSENSLRHSKALMDDLISLGFKKEKLFVVINNRFQSELPQPSVMKIQTMLDAPIEANFPLSAEVFNYASSNHTFASLVEEEGQSDQVARQYLELAKKIEYRLNKSAKP